MALPATSVVPDVRSPAPRRAAAQPRHRAGQHGRPPDEGPDPLHRRRVRRRPDPRRLRAHVRAGQGLAARARHPDPHRAGHGAQRRHRLPHRPGGVRTARGRPHGGRAGRAVARGVVLAGQVAAHRRAARVDQAAGRRRRARRNGPRGRTRPARARRGEGLRAPARRRPGAPGGPVHVPRGQHRGGVRADRRAVAAPRARRRLVRRRAGPRSRRAPLVPAQSARGHGGQGRHAGVVHNPGRPRRRGRARRAGGRRRPGRHACAAAGAGQRAAVPRGARTGCGTTRARRRRRARHGPRRGARAVHVGR